LLIKYLLFTPSFVLIPERLHPIARSLQEEQAESGRTSYFSKSKRGGFDWGTTYYV